MKRMCPFCSTFAWGVPPTMDQLRAPHHPECPTLPEHLGAKMRALLAQATKARAARAKGASAARERRERAPLPTAGARGRER